MIYRVNIDDIESSLNALGGKATAKDIQSFVLHYYCSGEIPDNYASERSFRQTIQRKIEDYCPEAEGFDENNKPAKFARVSHGVYQLISDISDFNELPEEVREPTAYYEGALKKMTVNSYERNSIARKMCLQYYGFSCAVCSMNFEETYGELGKGYIHVHHLIPLADVGELYQLNPIEDLRPICPNCHAMLHRKSPPLTIPELQGLLSMHESQN